MEQLSVLDSRKKSTVTKLTRSSKIFKTIIQAREDKKVRVKAFEKMMNQEKLPMRPPTDKISLSSMFAETPEEKNQPREMNPPFIKGDQTFYGSEPDKSYIGTQLKDDYGAYFIG